MEANKKLAITICGTLGSGKSTAAKLLAEHYGYIHYSGGDFMRTMADEAGIAMTEYSMMAEQNADIDKEIDRRQKEFMNTHDNFVIDSRLGWFFEPKAFKVFLSLDEDTASERILADLEKNELRKKGEHAENKEEILAKIRHRLSSERKRYNDYYGIEDHFDPKHFDCIIDTKNHSREEVFAEIVRQFDIWKSA